MNDFDITDIENTFKTIVKNLNVTTTVYTERPKAKLQSEDFAVVMVTGKVDDRRSLGECEVGVHLFARDVSAEKNGAKLKVMYEKLVTGMPSESGRYLIDTCPFVLPDVGDDYGFHARIITFNVTIKAV